MQDQSFYIHEQWRIAFNGRVLRPTWNFKGASDAALRLLKDGFGTVTATGDIRWLTNPRTKNISKKVV